MSHRLALTLALVLTIAFAGLLIVERERLFGAPIPDAPASLVTPPAAPNRTGAQTPELGPILDAAGPGGIDSIEGAPIDLVQPVDAGLDQAVAPAAGEGSQELTPRREQRRRDHSDDHGDDHDAEHAEGGDND